MNSYALLGYPLKHTMSPPIHRRLFELAGISGVSYDIIEASAIPYESLKELSGYNITIPHKVSITDYLDRLDPTAERYNSVNCVLNKEGVSVGFNTDSTGFLRSLESCGKKFCGKVLLFGCGGAGRMIAAEAVSGGADLTVAVRQGSENNARKTISSILSEENAAKVKIVTKDEIEGYYDILVNSTPAGMYPNIDESPCEEETIKKCGFVFDIIYNPRETKLLRIARENGIESIDGMPMLVWQAAAAHEIWDGSRYDIKDINALIDDMRDFL